MSTNIFESTSFDDLLKQAGVTALNPEISVDKTDEQIAEERTESYRVSASVLAEETPSKEVEEKPVAQVWGSTEPSTGVVSDEPAPADNSQPVTGVPSQTTDWGATSSESTKETTSPSTNPWGAWGGSTTEGTDPNTSAKTVDEPVTTISEPVTSEGSWASLMAMVPEEKPSNTTVFSPETPTLQETPAQPTTQPVQASSDDLKPLIRQVVVEVLSEILNNLR